MRDQHDEDEEGCATCGGTGIVEYDEATARGEHDTAVRPCPSCTEEDDGDYSEQAEYDLGGEAG